jgi:hypothetical protein
METDWLLRRVDEPLHMSDGRPPVHDSKANRHGTRRLMIALMAALLQELFALARSLLPRDSLGRDLHYQTAKVPSPRLRAVLMISSHLLHDLGVFGLMRRVAVPVLPLRYHRL